MVSGVRIYKLRFFTNQMPSLDLAHALASVGLGLWPYPLSIFTIADPTYNPYFKAKHTQIPCSAG